MNWEKCVFHWGKWYFKPIGNCVYTTAFRKDLDNTLTPLCPNVKKANINSSRNISTEKNETEQSALF